MLEVNITRLSALISINHHVFHLLVFKSGLSFLVNSYCEYGMIPSIDMS